MPRWTLPLSARETRRPERAGAKAASLARIKGARLPVPDGFVVTTDAYRAVADTISDALSSLSRSGSSSDRALSAASTAVRHAILEARFPRGLVSEIRQEWERLGKPPVSVRSSSTAEDLADASFAGQYDSFHNVTSQTDILEKIKQVWASLHSPRAIGYRRRHGASHIDPAMAVIVQTQRTPESAGVLFTRDPVSGKNQFVVTAAYGLGEGVVGGTAQTDRYILRPRSGKIASKDIAEKRLRIVPTSRGGIEAVPVLPEAQKRPALSPTQLQKLAGYGRRLVDVFGSAQDIEFAVTKGRLEILQSRPMTAIESAEKPERPWNKDVDRRYTWNRRGGPFRRLEQDVAVGRLKHLKDCYDETGSSMSVNHVGFVTNGYLYVRPNPVGERTLKKRHKLQTERVDRSLRKGKSYFEDVLQRIVEKRLAALARKRSRAKTLSAKVSYLEAALETEGYVQGNLHWRQGKPGGRRDWHAAFHEITGEPKHHANVYVQAIENRMTMAIRRIRELARIAQSDPELERIFLAREFDALTTPRIRRRAKMKQFEKRFKAMLKIYGIRAGHGYGTDSNLQTPTWNMDHTIPYEFIATYVEQDLDELDRMEKEARAERTRAIAKMRRKLSGDTEKLEAFNKALEEATIGVRFLEDHNYYMEQCTIGTFREAIDLVGRALVERDQIDDPDDVFHFSIDDLKAIARRKPYDLRPTVVERTAERERRKRMNPPRTLGKRPPRPKKGKDDTPPAGLDGSIIRGQSASSGRITGRAVVARPGQDHPHLRPGDILVAENVGPDWTPLFATMGGLVLDSGSLGQHAALVAREYKVPSVMQTKEASRVIQNGQRITVDGSEGVVELIQSEQ